MSFSFILVACDTALSGSSLSLGSWTQLRTVNHFSARNHHNSVVLGGDIYVIGGYDGVNFLDDVWVFQ